MATLKTQRATQRSRHVPNAALVALLLGTVLAGISPHASAAATNGGLCELKWQGSTSSPTVASGLQVPAGTLLTFGLGTNAMAAGDVLAIQFPHGTSFAGNLTPADFTVRQTATNTGTAPCASNAGASGTATAPMAGSTLDPSTYTVRLKVASASLTTGSNAGKGLVTVALDRAGAIRFPTCPPMALPLTVTHFDASGTVKRNGAVDNSFAFTTGATGQGCIRFVDMPQDTGRGLPFVPAVRVRLTDTSGSPVAGETVRLEVAGAPAGVWLANAPGQDIQAAPSAVTPPAQPMAGPSATTDSNGIAAFAGLAVMVDGMAFTGAFHRLHAVSSRGWVDSEPFRVGPTGPPWMQHQFSPQRTGWSPNVADFSDPADRTVIARVPGYGLPGVGWLGSLGDVATVPILADFDSDGKLDVAVANRVKQGTVGATYSGLQVWDLDSCASSCSPALLWRVILNNINNGHGIPDGSIEANLAAVYGPGRVRPTVIAVTSTNHDVTHFAASSLAAYNDGVQASTFNSWPYVSIPPLVANVGPGGGPAVAALTLGGAGQSRVALYPVTSAGALPWAQGGSYPAGEAFGGALASAEMRGGNLLPEIVVSSAHQVFPGGLSGGVATYGGSQGWNSATIAVCSPTSASPSCSETTTLADAAVTGLGIADMDGDGRLEVVANGVRSGTAQGAYGASQGQLNVYRGTTVPIGSPLRYVEGSDFYNSPALGSLDAADQGGPVRIVNVNYGAPPTDDYTGGDSYSVSGNVYVRDFDAASSAITDQGVWNRLTGESPGGGILLTLDPSHGYRPDYVFGSSDGTVTAARVIDTSSTSPPTQMWSMGGLGSFTSGDASQGIPMAPLAAGDVTGDCHAEIFAGLSGGSTGRGEVAVLKGKDATAPTAPLWGSPFDYDVVPASAAWANAPAPDQDTAPGSGFKAKIAWNRPASDGGLPVVAYKVYRTTGLPANGGPTGTWELVAVWPSGSPPTFTASSTPDYRPLTDLLPAPGDYYYRVAAMTCFTLAKDPSGIGDLSAPFYVEAKFGQVSNARAVPSGDPAFPAPVKVTVAWDRLDNYARPHGCGWADRYNLYKSTSPTNIIAAANKVASSPWPAAGGSASGPGFAVTDTAVTRAGWDGNPDANGNGAGGITYYAVNPVNCVGERNVDPDPPYADPPPTLVMANTRVPKAPNLAPLQAVTAPSGIKLTWTPDPAVNGCAADTAGLGGTVVGYQVYRGTAPGALTLYDTVLSTGPVGTPGQAAPWWAASPASNPTPGAVATTYTDYGVAGGVQYYYQVSTVNCVGESLRSATRTLAQLPDAPTGLVARPHGDPAYAASAPKKVRLDWTGLGPGQWGGCDGGFGYAIHRGPPGGPYAHEATVPSPATTWTDDGSVAGFPLVVGTSHDYVVTAQCTSPALIESPYSGPARADILVPAAPTLAAPVMGSAPSFTLSWNAPASPVAACPWIEGYRIYRGTAGPGSGTLHATVLPAGVPSWPRPLYGPAPAVPATTFTDTALVVGQTYHYEVTAVDCVGESVRSNEVSSTAAWLQATLTPASATGLASTLFTMTPSVTGGTPAYSCTWAVLPPPVLWNPPGAASACTAAATLQGTPGTTYTVTLTARDESNPMQTATATSVLRVNPPLSAAIDPASAIGTPATTFTLRPRIEGGVPPFGCAWSITPPGGTFVPPTVDPCTEPATFSGGAIGTAYLVQFSVTDSATPAASASGLSRLDVVANRPPIAEFAPSPDHAPPGAAVRMVDASRDPDGAIVDWLWDFGDGTTSSGQSPFHAFPRPGTYHVRLTVTDNLGATSSTVRSVVVAFEQWQEAPEPSPAVGGSGGADTLLADAGPDQAVKEGVTVRLAGSARGGDGSRVTYDWYQVGSMPVTLQAAGTASPLFVAPLVAEGETLVLRFALQVSQGAAVSPADTVDVTVTGRNRAPVARTTETLMALEGDPVVLDASASTDADGDPLRFSWRQTLGPRVDLQGAASARLEFAAPAYGMGHQLEFEVTVSDGRSAAKGLAVLVVLPRAPDASFTAAPEGASGYAFAPRGAAATHLWDFGDGSPASDETRPVHTYAAPGTYKVRLTATAASGAQASSEQDVVVAPGEATGKSAPARNDVAFAWVVAAAALFALLVVLLLVARSRRKGGQA